MPAPGRFASAVPDREKRNATPEIALAPGEIALRFYHQEGDSLRWQAFARDFADSDAEVGRVVMENSVYRFNYIREGTDCFYGDTRLVPPGICLRNQEYLRAAVNRFRVDTSKYIPIYRIYMKAVSDESD